MSDLKALEIGCMFWADRDSIASVAAMGVRCGQLGISGETAVSGSFLEGIAADVAAHQFRLITVVASYRGEDYADLPTVQRTVGFIPAPTREERLTRTMELVDAAAILQVGGIACHIGFVPQSKVSADYIAVREMVRRVCDYAGEQGQTFALETGQEPALELLEFIHDVDRTNLKVNFDPANMILYGSGDPHDAVRILAAKIVSVHAKDGDWPLPGELGRERPLGRGMVDFPRFIGTLKSVGYEGALCIERETQDPKERVADMQAAVPFLRGLV